MHCINVLTKALAPGDDKGVTMLIGGKRTSEMIEHVGLVNFLEGIGVDVDPNMISSPRSNPYIRMDDWDEEAEKWFEKKAARAG